MLLVDVNHLSTLHCKNPIKAELKYATTKNFVGRLIAGYHENATDIALLEQEAAEQLCKIQNYLQENHCCGLIIYDAYRPKRAVLDFLNWSTQPIHNEQETTRKMKHYPAIRKDQFFSLGYVVEDSEHCYGNTCRCISN
jgi:D-alanyl-D-alanine dipeptidase